MCVRTFANGYKQSKQSPNKQNQQRTSIQQDPHVSVCLCVCIFLLVYICMYVYVCICNVHIHIHVYICICVCVYIYIYIHTHMFICVYMRIQAHALARKTYMISVQHAFIGAYIQACFTCFDRQIGVALRRMIKHFTHVFENKIFEAPHACRGCSQTRHCILSFFDRFWMDIYLPVIQDSIREVRVRSEHRWWRRILFHQPKVILGAHENAISVSTSIRCTCSDRIHEMDAEWCLFLKHSLHICTMPNCSVCCNTDNSMHENMMNSGCATWDFMSKRVYISAPGCLMHVLLSDACIFQDACTCIFQVHVYFKRECSIVGQFVQNLSYWMLFSNCHGTCEHPGCDRCVITCAHGVHAKQTVRTCALQWLCETYKGKLGFQRCLKDTRINKHDLGLLKRHIYVFKCINVLTSREAAEHALS